MGAGAVLMGLEGFPDAKVPGLEGVGAGSGADALLVRSASLGAEATSGKAKDEKAKGGA